MQGASLLTALLMLAVIMLLGTSAAHMALINEKSSRNSRDRQIAYAAAEAALQDAVHDLTSGRARPEAFTLATGTCHVHGAFAGLCRGTPARLPAPEQLAHAVALGSFSMRRYDAGTAAAPRYLIELIELTPGSTDAAINPGARLLRYRITALGVGLHSNSRAVLQSVHEASIGPGSKAILAGRRLSWRDLTDILP